MDTEETQKQKNEALIKKRAQYYGEILPSLRILHEHEKLTCEMHEYALRSKLAKIKLAEVVASQQPEKPIKKD
jgi:hypothetical protein